MSMTASQIARELKALPQEVQRASRTARLKAGRRARTETARRLRRDVKKPRERVKGRREVLWVGANPVAADYIPGGVVVREREVSILGKTVSDAFRFDPRAKTSSGDWTQDGYITMQRQGQSFRRYEVDFDQRAGEVFDEVADETAELFLEEFDKELSRIVGAA